MGKVIAVCISEKKGTQKHPVEEAEFVEDWGIKNDAHAGKWHRQVSLLSYDKIEAFRARGAEVEDGAFGENGIWFLLLLFLFAGRGFGWGGNELHYSIDGVVVSVINNDGEVSDNEIAIKILNNIKETRIINIDYQYGKTMINSGLKAHDAFSDVMATIGVFYAQQKNEEYDS